MATVSTPRPVRTLTVMDDCPECAGKGYRVHYHAEGVEGTPVECGQCNGRGTWPVQVPLPEDWEPEPHD